MIIKALLIASVLVGSVWLLRGQRRPGRLALTRLSGILVALGWIAAVLWPSVVTSVAGWVGVGRGTDLLLYVMVVVFTFSSVLHQRRLSELDAQIAQLTRSQAIWEQVGPDQAWSAPTVGSRQGQN